MSDKFFALWTDSTGGQHWDGPFPTNVKAAERVPSSAKASLVTRTIVMTPAEKREALPILEGRLWTRSQSCTSA